MFDFHLENKTHNMEIKHTLYFMYECCGKFMSLQKHKATLDVMRAPHDGCGPKIGTLKVLC